MATSRIVLTPEVAVLPTSNPATLTKVTSSATATTNTPKPTYNKLEYNDSTDKHAIFNLPIPADYLSTAAPVLKIWWTAAPTSGNVVWIAGLGVVVVGTTDFDASTFLAADSFGAIAVPGTAGIVKTSSVTLTATGLVAAGFASLFIGRDADAGTDTAVGNAELLGAVLEYTS